MRILASLLLALAGLALPTSAQALGDLYRSSCVLGSESPVPLAQAEQSSGWVCGPDIASARHSYLWVRVDQADLPWGEAQDLQSDALAFAGLDIVVRMADGSDISRRFDARAVADHWTAGTRFSIPLYGAGDRPQAAFIRVDRPYDHLTATRLSLVRSDGVAGERLRSMILFGVFSGMMLIAALYGAILYFALRSRFAIYHTLMVLFLLSYTTASSSMVFLILPDITLLQRTSMSYMSIALGMAMLSPFLLDYLEQEAISPAMRRFVIGSGLLTAVNSLSMPLLGHLAPFVVRPVFHALFLPAVVCLVLLGVQAWRRGSHAVGLVALAWSVPCAFAVERVLRGLNFYSSSFVLDYAFYTSMAFEAIVMALGVSWRVGHLRRERDLALAQNSALDHLAQTDPLTGLANRRAFDENHWRKGDYLAALDIDHFKSVNDAYGHQAGDVVLQAVGKAIAAAIEEGALLRGWRLGGEEFAVLVASSSIDEAALRVNRLRERISAEVKTAVPAIERTVTVSAGLALAGDAGVDATFRAADAALYHAKQSGRDRLCYEAEDAAFATIFPRRAA